jgi:hypothetical protein
MDLIHGIQATMDIKTSALGKGADVVGIADLGLLKGIPTKPGNLLEYPGRRLSRMRRMYDGMPVGQKKNTTQV